ncbi:hypothetical protein [Thermoleptolyngbya sp.]
MSILDGFQGGRQYFYHLVTDVSADVPSVLEKGVFAPALANIPAFGKSLPSDQSPLWYAHVSMWTERAIAENKVRRITSFEDLEGLIKSGIVTSAYINPEGPGNNWLYGLRPTRARIIRFCKPSESYAKNFP